MNAGNKSLTQCEGSSQAIQQVAVPEGWKLVPVEPTREMLAVLTGEWHSSRHTDMRNRWDVMLAASPTPPVCPAIPGSSDHLAACDGGGVKVPLTDDAVRKVYRSVFDENAPRIYGIAERFARAIEAAHGINPDSGAQGEEKL